MAYIYKINNDINNKFYVGSSNNYTRRWDQHIYELNRNKHDNIHLQRAWNKYGKDSFSFSIIEECDNNKQYEREQYYLDILQPFGNIGYNMSKIANGSNGDNADYELITQIKELMKKCYSNKEISKITGKTETMIDCIRGLRTWDYVSPELNIFLSNRSRLKVINTNCIIKFGIDLNELKNKINKTQDEDEFLIDTDKYLNDYEYRLKRIKEYEEKEFY
jgi:group I intron endonuclease